MKMKRNTTSGDGTSGPKNGLDQCPSSAKEGRPATKPLTARQLSRATGRSLWRSFDELARTSEFRDFLQREFPAHASELLDGSRRHFLKIMGASLALAGVGSLSGCRRPDHRILAYNDAPEHSIPGKALYYATAMPLPGGGCEGILAETHEGRPTKIEGNPLHPINRGKSSSWAQASVLDLYDPDRDSELYHTDEAGTLTDWATFRDGHASENPNEAVPSAADRFAAFDATQGAGLAFLVDKTTSPSRDRMRDRILQRWPQARWYAYEPADDEHARAGSQMAFGSAQRERWDLSRAQVVLSVDRDFLGGEGSGLDVVRGFSQSRYRAGTRPGHEAEDSQMNRLYVLEATMTLTGGQSDHRYALKPSRIGAALVTVADHVMTALGGANQPVLQSSLQAAAASVAGDDLPSDEEFRAIADDLVAHRGAGAIMVGPSQPAEIHALGAALNAALGNVGPVVSYSPMGADQAQSSVNSIQALARDLSSGQIQSVVILGCNPVYDAPADVEFPAALASASTRIHLGSACETAEACNIRFLRSHDLERWSDVTAADGTYSAIQPQIAPLFDSVDDLQFFATILGDARADAYEIVRETVRQRTTRDAVGFERAWRRTLHDGSLAGSQTQGATPSVRWDQVTAGVRSVADSLAPSAGIEVVFAPCPKVHDGRFANNGWLQELPQSVTKVSWDNPGLISKTTADRLGISTNRHRTSAQYNHAQVATVQVDGRSVDAPMWLQPGIADDVIVLHLGYGRTRGGRIGQGVGFSAYAIRTTGAMRVAQGAQVERTRGASAHLIACTQDHWSLEGREDSIFNEVDLAAWKRFGDVNFDDDESIQVDAYGRRRGLNFAGRLTLESHTPANVDVYLDKQRAMYGKQFIELDENGEPMRDGRGRLVGKTNDYGKRIQQWGMTIDLTTCTGCSACTIACQAENNIPIVGKKEVAKGREMHWIRVDRYYASGPDATDKGMGRDGYTGAGVDMVTMPVPCMQCENAPCEVVCPVSATPHSPEGLNDMAYNRCIGTRYCSNNCPYKVRRFNYFDYGTKQFEGSNVLSGTMLEPDNENLIPPRLRQKKLEVATMQNNPHVTVRSRGVMEKCTYCVQRINAARVETKLSDLDAIPDGFVQTACQQACPSDSIVFGDIFDNDANDGAGSRVNQLRHGARSYSVLGYLNTGPRTTFLVRLRNPNPAIRPPNEDPFHHHGGDHHDDDSHGDDGEHAKADGVIMSLPVLAQQGGTPMASAATAAAATGVMA